VIKKGLMNKVRNVIIMIIGRCLDDSGVISQRTRLLKDRMLRRIFGPNERSDVMTPCQLVNSYVVLGDLPCFSVDPEYRFPKRWELFTIRCGIICLKEICESCTMWSFMVCTSCQITARSIR
jgi:hypothetical protein